METGRVPDCKEEIRPGEIRRIGGRIALKKANQWRKNYRQTNPDETVSHLFGRDIIEKILSQEDCMGIRIYYANRKQLHTWQRLVLLFSDFLRKTVANAVGEKELILVGVDSYANDQLSDGKYKPKPVPKITQENLAFIANASAEDQDEAFIAADQSWPCPGLRGCP